MSLTTDGVLAVIALGAFVGGLTLANAPLSVPFLAVGGLGTLAFEAVAFSHSEPVRDYWERPVVQAGTLAGAFAIAIVGVVVAPSQILSTGIGSVVVYFLVLAAVVVTRS